MNKFLGILSNILLAPVSDVGGGASSNPNGGSDSAPMSGEDNFYGSTPAAAPAAPTRPASKPAGPAPEAGAADDDFGGAGSGDEGDSSDLDASDDNDETSGEMPDDLRDLEGDEAAGTPAPAAPASPVLRLDAESLAAIRGTQNQQPKGEVGFTPDQIKQIFNPVIVTPDTLAELGFTDASPEQVAGFQKFTNSIVKNSVSIVKYLMQQKEAEFNRTLQPLMHERQQVAQQNVQKAFYEKFPSLSKYGKAVKMAATEVSATNADGSEKSQEQLFKDVAGQTLKNLKLLGVQINKPQANHSADGGSQGSGVPRPNKLSSSGRSGGDQHSNRGKPNNADADIYAGR